MEKSLPSPGGATDEVRSVAPPGLGDVFDCVRWFLHRLISSVPPGQKVIPDLSVRWFLHRLISSVPPGQKVIPDLSRNFIQTVCATIAAAPAEDATLLNITSRVRLWQSVALHFSI